MSDIKKLSPMPGLKIWKNPKNKFLVFEAHYTADPAKRTDEWKDRNKSGMPIRDWNMEYEITWESWLGLPIFTDWIGSKHVSKTRMLPVAGLPLLRGWDFGLTPACIVCQYVENELRVLKEYKEFNMGALRFSAKVLKEVKIDFGRWSDQKKHWKDFIDPSGEFRKDTDEGTCAMILQGAGLTTIPGAIAWEERKKSVEEWLTKFGPEGALLRVNEEDCPLFIKAMNGGYQYPKDSDIIQPKLLRPVKNKYSHIADAFQMITSRLSSLRHTSGLSVPSPKYSPG